MTDQKPKTKADWTSWKNKPYAAGDDKKKQQAEAFELLNSFVRHHGGSITSPPGRFVRIECPKDSLLPAKLRELGYIITDHGSVTRITGMDYVKPVDEKFTGTPSPFAEYHVLEVRLDGK
jgi:hypothetical protein